MMPMRGAPEEHQADLGGDVGPEDELARGQPDPRADQAGTDDAPAAIGRVRQITDGDGG